MRVYSGYFLSVVTFPPICGFAAVALLAGCVAPMPSTAPSPAPDSTKYTVENGEKLVLLDPTAEAEVACTELQERLLPDGRLDVVANVMNRTDRSVAVQIQCVFKSEEGSSVDDETPWQTVALDGRAIEAVHFAAHRALAKRYTLRIRQAR